ncbi:MAG TPA: SIS domain-containing protein [Candidatus Magasanikbacteria bacterium]|nr:SIS domain-containing protein [Candidatus Magasanikbacteria bacterium]
MKILDNLAKIKQLDSKNMLGSIELLGEQIKEVGKAVKNIKIPKNYKKFENVVVCGMGGSALGAHLIKSVYKNDLKIPLSIVNGYQLPGFANKNTLVILSSYSGNTEEVLSCATEAKKKKCKITVISAGGKLEALAKKEKYPALIFTTNNNPCGSPRMGLGYSIVGQIYLFAKLGLLKTKTEDLKRIPKLIGGLNKKFGVKTKNLVKDVAEKTKDKSVWFIGSSHLGGSAHIAANQMNENAKRFGGYFLLPELNHHLLEGMINPKSNKNNLLFIFLESDLYSDKIKQRISLTKEVLKMNKINFVTIKTHEKSALAQAMEILLVSSYLSFYSAIVEDIDPTAIPFVDFLKKKLK